MDHNQNIDEEQTTSRPIKQYKKNIGCFRIYNNNKMNMPKRIDLRTTAQLNKTIALLKASHEYIKKQ